MAKIIIKKKQEIDEDAILDEVAPTQKEIEDAKIEVKVLTVLMEVL